MGLLSFLWFHSFTSYGQNQTVSIGAVHYPPYYDFEEGKKRPKGFLAKHLEKSLGKAGYKVSWRRTPLGRGERSLKKNIIQVYGSFAPGPGDKSDVRYSPTPLIKMQTVVCGFKNSLKSPSSVTDEDIKAKTVVYPRGAYFHPKLEQLKLEIERLDYSGDYISRAIKMIEKERANFFILPESFRIRPYLKSYSDLQCSNFIDTIAMHLSFAPTGPWLERIAPLVKEYPAKISIEAELD